MSGRLGDEDTTGALIPGTREPDDDELAPPSPAAAGLPLEDVERVARAIQDASAREGVVLVGYEIRSPMTAAGPLGLESARRLAAAALAEMRPTAAEEADSHCTARIWPSWSDRWVRCNSPVGPDGKCQRYGHAPVPPDANGGEER